MCDKYSLGSAGHACRTLDELYEGLTTEIRSPRNHLTSFGTRTQLAATLDFIREGDTLVVTKLDRLARSVSHLMQILDDLSAKSAHLRILGLGIDTAGPAGKLILTVLGGMAEFERGIMLERQHEGIAKAKAAGKYKGRKPTARAKSKEVMGLHASGTRTSAIARQLGIGRASVYRIINAHEAIAQT